MTLRQALTNIHRDRDWWRKVLIGGTLSLSVVGVPWSAGYVVESMTNIRKGFPTPLPPWFDWGTRYLLGLLALLVDFLFFVLPLLITGILVICGGTALVLANARDASVWLLPIFFGLLGLFQFMMFLSSVAPIARLRFIREGRIEEALDASVVRRGWERELRSTYLQARWQSLPIYLPVILVGVIIWLVAQQAFSGSGWVLLGLLWLLQCALFYAHLVVAQLYAAAERRLGI
jgi:hypothetical protein